MVARITWLGHATVLVDAGAARVLTDPVLRSRVAHLRRLGPAPDLPDRLDAVLLSHLHLDHADVPTLRRLGGEVPVAGPRGTASALRRAGLRHVRELEVGDRVEVAPGVTVHAVPARHDGRRHPLATHAEALGFVIEADSRRLYFAGDTDLFDGMRGIGDDGVDLALLPIWGWGPSVGAGHLDPVRAARAAALLRPRIAVPIHWGTYRSPSLGRAQPDPGERPVRDFVARAAEAAPDVRVVVLAPGEELDLD